MVHGYKTFRVLPGICVWSVLTIVIRKDKEHEMTVFPFKIPKSGFL